MTDKAGKTTTEFMMTTAVVLLFIVSKSAARTFVLPDLEPGAMDEPFFYLVNLYVGGRVALKVADKFARRPEVAAPAPATVIKNETSVSDAELVARATPRGPME
jgi:hypothetical protein